MENKGMLWCREKVKSREIYVTKADKGGSILILDAKEVEEIMTSELGDTEKYEPLDKDPRAEIRKTVIQKIETHISSGVLTNVERFYITGKTEKDGYSKQHDFCITKPYMYPLFKIHKLNEEQITQKVIPPVRMVTASVGGPTYRLGIFLNGLLQPVADKYCDGEVIKDTTHFIQVTDSLKEKGYFRDASVYQAVLDIDGLYPNIRRDLALDAIKDALEVSTGYTSEQIVMILDLLKCCLNNSVIHYRGNWYRSLVGVPTGGSESCPIANIFVKWILDKYILTDTTILSKNKIQVRRRFLDDLWMIWAGNPRQFELFKNSLNNIGRKYGITMKGECSKVVEFLDVKLSIEDGDLKTSLFIKPTDSKRYLNRRSQHSQHTFKAIPYSQFRRAVIISSDSKDKLMSINYMLDKFINSGYTYPDLLVAKMRALSLDRKALLDGKQEVDDLNKPKIITFVMYHDVELVGAIKSLLKEKEEDIKLLVGDKRIVVAEKKHPNVSSLFFAKASFSRELQKKQYTQKCGARGCKTCMVMKVPSRLSIKGFDLNIDYRLNCKTDNIIYIAICKHCSSENNFYFGQTTTQANIRMNGHRQKFNVNLYDKSALSYHIYAEHFELFGEKLNNYDIGIVRSVRPMDLDRVEDFYIYNTRADVISINRYKVAG